MEAASEAYSQAIKDNHSPIIVRQRERDLVMKLYGTNEQVEDVVKLTELIDPLPFSQEVKTLVYNNRGCTQFDYILSTNLHKYINMVLKDYSENDIEESEIKVKNDKSEEGISSAVISGTELKRKGIKSIHVPLMGAGYDEVHIEDFSIAGEVYYIISGHGGPDPGAVCSDCPSKMCEDEYAYDVALRLARNLMQHGATVEMIVQDENDGIRDEKYLKCDHDEKTLGNKVIPLGQKARLQERAYTVNKLHKKYKKKGFKVHKAIEIHVDSRSKNTRQDVFFYYNKHNKISKELANSVQKVFESKYETHQKGRGYTGFVEDREIQRKWRSII
jgi:N-acetylmuramoyl-L-alanine amidase